MLPVQQRKALSTDWVVEFDQHALRRPHAVHPSDGRFIPALRTIGDAADGSSPKQADRGGLTVLFDGILYERPDLARTLGDGADGNDAALVLAAVARWGDDFLDHIKGLFAVVVWDHRSSRLIAARDPFGEYPLFVADNDGRELLFSKSIDALLADPRVRRSLNRAAIADHLCQRWPDATETFFQGIRRVPSGHRFISTAAGQTLERYWHPFPDDLPTEGSSSTDLEEFDFRLETAVDRVLRQGPSGILLSGGLDSVTVASTATDLAQRQGYPQPIAFSLAYPAPWAEEPVQRGVATTLGMSQDVVPFWDAVGQGGLLSEMLRMTRTFPVMLNSPWTPAFDHLIGRAAQRGMRTVMTGTGGDEGFSLNPLYAAEAMRSGDVKGLVSYMAAWRRSYNVPASWYLKGMLWAYGLRPLGVSALERLCPTPLNTLRVRRSMQFAPAYIAPDSSLRAELAQRVQHSFESRKTTGPLHVREITSQLEHPIVSQAREEHYERGRRSGVQLRHPFFDADLATMVYRMPHSVLFGDGRAKYPLRRRVAPRFPSLGFDRQKKLGGSGFFRSILASELPALVPKISLSPLSQLGIIDMRGAQTMITDGLQSENRRSLLPVWELLRLAAWADSRL